MNQQDPYLQYEERLDKNYAFMGENCEDMVGRKISALIQFLNRKKPSRKLKVLDVGCGIGLAEKLLSQSPFIESITGIDLSINSLEIARNRKLPFSHYLRADGTHLPFQDSSFDIVFTICTLHHVSPSRRDEFMREMYRVLKPEGWLFAFEHNPFNPVTRFFVNMCEFDRGCQLLWPRELMKNFARTNLREINRHFLVFFPSLLKPMLAFEPHLSWFPLGAQFFVRGKK